MPTICRGGGLFSDAKRLLLHTDLCKASVAPLILRLTTLNLGLLTEKEKQGKKMGARHRTQSALQIRRMGCQPAGIHNFPSRLGIERLLTDTFLCHPPLRSSMQLRWPRG